ncbi:MAG: hypothetical protein JNM93_00070 [Bacteriovoracaceae bacterium]|nr:hypothetical protein [Bacteriovoracaceae bacterium]
MMLQLSKLPPARKKKFLKDLSYLNTKEYLSLCKKYEIPFDIYYISESGALKKTKLRDRKAIVLKRLRTYLMQGKIAKPTVFNQDVVNLKLKILHPTKKHHLHFGQYDKKNSEMNKLLKSLTKGHFKDGALAREILCEFWSRGYAPTFSEFAKVWLTAYEAEKKNPHPEWAYLYDKKQKVSLKQWKKKRQQIAKNVLSTFHIIST